MMCLPLGDCTTFCVLVLVLALDLDLKMALTCEPLEGSWEVQGPQITLWKLQSRSFSVSLSWVSFFSCRILLLAVWAGAHHLSQVSLPAGWTCKAVLTSTAASSSKACFSKKDAFWSPWLADWMFWFVPPAEQTGLPRWLSGKEPASLWRRHRRHETRVQSLGQEDPLEEGMAPHSSIPTWRIPWTEEPGRL